MENHLARAIEKAKELEKKLAESRARRSQASNKDR